VSEVDVIRNLLKDEIKDKSPGHGVECYPYLNLAYDDISLQFCGWAVHLKQDGTWYWEATDGG